VRIDGYLPDPGCGPAMTEQGARPTKGLRDKGGKGGQKPGSCTVAERELVQMWMAGRTSSTAGGPTMATAVQWGPGGGQDNCHPNTVASGPYAGSRVTPTGAGRGTRADGGVAAPTRSEPRRRLQGRDSNLKATNR